MQYIQLGILCVIPSLDCSVFEVVSPTLCATATLQEEISSIADWTAANNIRLIAEFIVSFMKDQPALEPLKINNVHLGTVKCTKLFGVLSSDL